MVAAPRYITDEQGNRTGVILDIADYEAMLDALEDAADVRAYDAAKASGDEYIPLEQALREIEEGKVRA